MSLLLLKKGSRRRRETTTGQSFRDSISRLQNISTPNFLTLIFGSALVFPKKWIPNFTNFPHPKKKTFLLVQKTFSVLSMWKINISWNWETLVKLWKFIFFREKHELSQLKLQPRTFCTGFNHELLACRTFQPRNFHFQAWTPNFSTLEKSKSASLQLRARPDWAYEFPDRTGPDTQICRTSPAGLDWIRTYIFKHFTYQVPGYQFL